MRPVPSGAADFVARHEGLRLESYQDTGGVWTVGYGHTGADVRPGLRISLGKAKALLAQDLRVAAARLQAVVKRPVIEDLTENQYAALLSFVFNLGAESRWTIWKVLNARQFDQVPVQLMRWVYVGQAKVRGLVSRRAAEVALWSAGEPGSVDEDPPSSVTRIEATPPASLDPRPLMRSGGFVSTASAGVATAAVAVGEVSRAVTPYAQQSAIVGRALAMLSLIAALLAALGVLFVWLKKRESRT
jgi:lysozyme